MKITSLQNTTLKAAVRLREARARQESQCFLVEGSREIERAVAQNFAVLQVFYCPAFFSEDAAALFSKLQQGAAGASAAWFELDEKCFNKLVVREGSGGLVVVFAVKKAVGLAALLTGQQGGAPLILAVEGLEKPGNLGAIIRSADGAGASGIVLLGRGADPYHPHVIRASLGCVFAQTLVVASNEEFYEFCQQENLAVISAMVNPASQQHFQHNYTQGCVLLLGSEAYGLSAFWQEHSSAYSYIPMLGQADSLNVAAAAAILLYEARRQRIAAVGASRS